MTDGSAEVNADNVQHCDLCILGAGIAGLNALFVASEYLGKNAKVVIIDRRSGPAGMWNDVYDYCRLHLPHPAFTVGDIAWQWSKPSDYLASGAEVKAHLVHCMDAMRGRVDLEELYCTTIIACDEIVTPQGPRVRVEYYSNDAPEKRRVIEAKRVIKAYGFDIPTPKPLPLTSHNVVSTSPERLSQDGEFDESTPVYVVGGGKTGMDTAQALIKRAPGRSINLINGKGTVFLNRATLFPRGARRWWDGQLLVSVFCEMAMRYDGTNEDEAFEYFRRRYGVQLDAPAERFLFGVLSKEERDVIGGGLTTIIDGYLDDVVDGPNSPEIVLRDGRRIPAQPGSVFVNCTGYVVRHSHPYEPYLSQHGAVLTITPRSMVHYLSSVSAYFLTHMFFLGKLKAAPLYEFDSETAFAKNRRVCGSAVLSLSLMNLIVLFGVLPFRVFDRCGLDLDRLFPLHRRVRAIIDLKLNGKRYVAHCRKALDRVRETHGLRCGPLATPTGQSGNTADLRAKSHAGLQQVS